MTTAQYRKAGVTMVVVGAAGFGLWWLVVSFAHVNFVIAPIICGLLVLAGIYVAVTGLKSK